MDERKAPKLTDEQCNIVSQTFYQIRKSIELAKQACADAGCDQGPVLEAVADLTAGHCGQHIK